jgi:phytoene/squalene synthetase
MPEVILEQAYDHCAEVVRRSDSSFAAAFWMFSKPRRRALHAIYAFCRLADDIADDPTVRGDRQRLLERWRSEVWLSGTRCIAIGCPKTSSWSCCAASNPTCSARA